jgi:glycosyltransferase involved in cell wall biosynthesis
MKVTVLLPVYNAGVPLKTALESIIRQNFDDYEILVIDDSSIDDSLRQIRRFQAQSSRIRVIAHPTNRGLAATLNEGLQAAYGEYVARMDQDDESLPDRLEMQAAFLDAHPECAVVGSYVYHMGATPSHDRLVATPVEAEAIAARLPISNCMYHPSTMLRRQAILDLGGYREQFKNAEDYDLWLRVSRLHALANIPVPLLRFRFSTSGMTLGRKWQMLYFVYLAQAAHREPNASFADLHNAAAAAIAATHRGRFFGVELRRTLEELVGLHQWGAAYRLIWNFRHEVGGRRAVKEGWAVARKFSAPVFAASRCEQNEAFWYSAGKVRQTSARQRSFHYAGGGLSNPPRIVALLPFLVEGTLSLNVLRELRRRGADVAVAFCGKGGRGYTPDPMTDFAAENRLIDLSPIPPGLLRDRLSREFEARRTRLALQIGAFALYPVLPYVKERLPTLRVVDILYNEVGHTLNHFLYEAYFDGVIVESQHMARFVRDSTLKTDPCVRVVESGIDLDRFSPGRRRPGDEPLRIGYIGRFSTEKNPLGFIDLFERLAECLPRLAATIAGDGPMVDDVRTRVKASPAAKRLTYLGRVLDVSDALRTLDVLVVPSKLDGRPNIVMEANACGVPVIGAPVGGIPELIEEGVNGYLAAPTETDRIATWLRAWDEDPSLLSEIRSSSRKWAEARFDRSRMIADYAVAFAHFAGS